jgi:hypothetical protein
MKNIACSRVGLLVLVLTGVSASAQNQAPSNSPSSSSGSSLGDYARQVRKDPGGKATPKVYDNDNLPKQDKLSVIGQKPTPTSDNTADTTSAQSGSAAPDNRDKSGTGEKVPLNSEAKGPEDEATKQAAAKQWGDKIAAQKEQIDLVGRELDVLQRDYQIRAAAMYADAGNRMRNEANWDKQDAQYKQQIADKQKALDDAKQKLDDLQEDARKAGAPTSVSEPQQQ